MTSNYNVYLLQDGRPDILYTFWTDVTRTLGEEFHRATEGKSASECHT